MKSKVQRPLPEMALGASVPKWSAPNLIFIRMVNDMVCALMKISGVAMWQPV